MPRRCADERHESAGIPGCASAPVGLADRRSVHRGVRACRGRCGHLQHDVLVGNAASGRGPGAPAPPSREEARQACRQHLPWSRRRRVERHRGRKPVAGNHRLADQRPASHRDDRGLRQHYVRGGGAERGALRIDHRSDVQGDRLPDGLLPGVGRPPDLAIRRGDRCGSARVPRRPASIWSAATTGRPR